MLVGRGSLSVEAEDVFFSGCICSVLSCRFCVVFGVISGVSICAIAFYGRRGSPDNWMSRTLAADLMINWMVAMVYVGLMNWMVGRVYVGLLVGPPPCHRPGQVAGCRAA